MLSKFKAAKALEIKTLQHLAQTGKMPLPHQGRRLSFTDSLKAEAGPAIIAEYKRASPSQGHINLAASPRETALAYAINGARAISVLTEKRYFKGNIKYLEQMAGAGLPLLRKDFIFHPLQMAHSAATPAAAVLLIVRMLEDGLYHNLLALAAQYGLQAVSEVFDKHDLKRAQASGAGIIQVNNRDLDTLRVDEAVSLNLITHKKDNEFWITASGIATRGQLLGLLDAGFDAALIGSSLMENQNPGAFLGALLAGESHA